MDNKVYDVEKHTKDSLKTVLDSTGFVNTYLDESAAVYSDINGAFVNNKGDTVARIYRSESNDFYHDKKYSDADAPLSSMSLDKTKHLTIQFIDGSKFTRFGKSFYDNKKYAEYENAFFFEKPKP